MITGPFRGSNALCSGLLTPARCADPDSAASFRTCTSPPRSTSPSRFVPELRLLVERRGGVLAGYSAAAVHRASCEPTGAPAEVLVPVHMKPQPDLLVHQGVASERVLLGGTAATSRFRTAWDLGRRLPLCEAVVAVDALARPPRAGDPPRFLPSALLDRRLLHPGARNSLRLDRVVALADPRAESPMETRMRLALVRAGLRPEVQYVLLDGRGRFVARVDLAFPRARLAIEYDGEEHDDSLDRARDIRTGALGRHTMRLQAADVYRRSARMVDAVRHQIRERTALFEGREHPHR
jgi:very-short-patch-repair endonuclease